ncbi:hypothetical protein [Aquamicrobium sp. LC103]|uniref:hypothetical protein n=1 Tax=Aquamicrobium sp. LC103 TaxID=1120658 RepID=UPI000A79EE26|nr:hypothetical protein [Aquamicrobium sp. LC103]
MNPAPTILQTFIRQFDTLRDIRNRARMARAIEALPRDIRKDIGWPDSYPSRGR